MTFIKINILREKIIINMKVTDSKTYMQSLKINIKVHKHFILITFIIYLITDISPSKIAMTLHNIYQH